MQPRELELLAPARDIEIARQAILHGADAIYIGGPSHGARAAATNTIEEIGELTDWAHLFGVKVYVTLNTIIYDRELKEVESNIKALYESGVDALIVQDMGLLRMDIPPIDLHASTQCDIRTVEKAQLLSQFGFSQLVLPREFSIDEIRAVRKAIDDNIKIETFIHGALCVSYSGDCQASCMAKGRSANRGECAQMCRLPYDLIDGDNKIVMHDKHLLSLRDLNRSLDIEALAESGIQSFKIEGRLKDAAYVKNTVASYRKIIDSLIAKYPEKYCRASNGNIHIKFDPDVNKSFNRGFTRYFTDGRPQKPIKMANLATPKWVGEPVGNVIGNIGNIITAKIDIPLNNGDGLGYFDKSGAYTGFHLNRVDGNKLYPATRTEIAPGTTLYRNRDTKFDNKMSQETASRLLELEFRLSYSNSTLRLDAKTENGVSITKAINTNIETARTPQKETRHRALSKLGNTIFSLTKFEDTVEDKTFIPISVLTNLRQDTIEELMLELRNNYKRKIRLPEKRDAQLPAGTVLTYHDNVANRLAEEFWREHGATQIEPSLEISSSNIDKNIPVMTTRYCIRRELGTCLLTPEGRKLKEPLTLRNNSATYMLEFDCKHCMMHLKTLRAHPTKNVKREVADLS